jgi:hypothetical protein
MTPQEIVQALKGLGLSQKAIGDVLGLNDSYISQVARGKKSGAHYAGALEQMLGLVQQSKGAGREPPRDELAARVQRPARRTTKSGRAARVRGAKHYAQGFTVSVGPVAARAGARSLMSALRSARDANLSTAYTLVFAARPGGAGGTKVARKSGSAGKGAHHPVKVAAKRRDWTEFQADPETILAYAEQRGGNVTLALIVYALETGWITHDGDRPPIADILAIEMRAW